MFVELIVISFYLIQAKESYYYKVVIDVMLFLSDLFIKRFFIRLYVDIEYASDTLVTILHANAYAYTHRKKHPD